MVNFITQILKRLELTLQRWFYSRGILGASQWWMPQDNLQLKSCIFIILLHFQLCQEKLFSRAPYRSCWLPKHTRPGDLNQEFKNTNVRIARDVNIFVILIANFIVHTRTSIWWKRIWQVFITNIPIDTKYIEVRLSHVS